DGRPRPSRPSEARQAVGPLSYSILCSADFLNHPPKVLFFSLTSAYLTQNVRASGMALPLLLEIARPKEEIMPNIHIDNVGDMAVVECEGRFVRSEDAFKLRDAVTSRSNARTVIVDLTETYAIGGGAIGMLVFLQRWAQDHNIRFKLFNPSRAVREKLEHTNSMSEFKIASLDEMM